MACVVSMISGTNLVETAGSRYSSHPTIPHSVDEIALPAKAYDCQFCQLPPGVARPSIRKSVKQHCRVRQWFCRIVFC
jgi:hypothetical protein